MEKVILTPPDGGYGWIIVFASVLNNFLMIPLIQNVGLIYKPKMIEIGMTISQMMRFGCRKVTLAGVSFVFLGMSLSSRIPNYEGFLLTFGLIASLGVGLNTSSYTLAIKSYFIENQNKAIGLSMTLTALGPILMPQIIKTLIHNYQPDDVILILACIISHGYIGALLLQPVKRHMVKKTVQEPEPEQTRQNLDTINEGVVDEPTKTSHYPIKPYMLFPPREFISNRRYPGFRRKESVISISYEQETTGIMGIDSTLGGSLYSLESLGQHKVTHLTKTTWWKSEDTINLDSSYDLFDEASEADQEESQNLKGDDPNTQWRSLPWYRRFLYQILDLVDLDLLSDLRYLNIMLGVSLILFVELNFTVLIPFLLDEYSLPISEMANFLSVLGAADILFRFLAPHIGDCLKLPVRVMLILIFVIIIVGRIVIIYTVSYPGILGIAFLMGCVKGLRMVFMSLVIPNYVPKERLASASAMQIVSNSFTNILGGYLIGELREMSGTFVTCIIVMNAITSLTIMLWSSDIIYKKCTRKKPEISTMTTVDKSDIY
ncbi:hypothetical protein GWI33_002725 [Rhynchophorus ferrugineus]|uniref:Uncharacterized protein n=1 Tax=Rhynchophorus ferrugineus TaxID=354439 RepID=A0A834IMP2_RHYFE|nr:hypothetical protein GWI33_002725 [Rhynchophorus ferrugineus]